jgi:large subunit ribosomal protein L6
MPLPNEVKAHLEDGAITLEGPKGKMSLKIPEGIKVALDDQNVLQVTRTNDTKQARANHGTTRALLGNILVGVTAGYSRELEIHGVGYKATLSGRTLTLDVGYSHQVVYTVPDEVDVEVTGNTQIKVSGIDKQLVGQVSARIRAFRPPEPYKGKGVRYKDEQVRRKAGKTVA